MGEQLNMLKEWWHGRYNRDTAAPEISQDYDCEVNMNMNSKHAFLFKLRLMYNVKENLTNKGLQEK